LADKLDLAPWSPTEIEVYLACKAMKQPIPRAAKKALVRAGLVRGDGEISGAGWTQIGRLRHLRKLGKVAERPKHRPPDVQFLNPPPKQKNYPGLGPRRERMARKKFERKMLEKPPPMLKAAVGAEQVQKTKDKLFESAYA